MTALTLAVFVIMIGYRIVKGRFEGSNTFDKSSMRSRRPWCWW